MPAVTARSVYLVHREAGPVDPVALVMGAIDPSEALQVVVSKYGVDTAKEPLKAARWADATVGELILKAYGEPPAPTVDPPVVERVEASHPLGVGEQGSAVPSVPVTEMSLPVDRESVPVETYTGPLEPVTVNAAGEIVPLVPESSAVGQDTAAPKSTVDPTTAANAL